MNNKWVRFAVLEFKRPGSIKGFEWVPATNGSGEIEGSGAKICRQLKKYAYSLALRYVSVCDFNLLILLRLGGNPGDWYNATPLLAGSTSAEIRWIAEAPEMKRNLYVFLKEALDECLRTQSVT
jgi:hypothetical protein